MGRVDGKWHAQIMFCPALKRLLVCGLGTLFLTGTPPALPAGEPEDLLKRRLMSEIRDDAERTAGYTGRRVLDGRVMAALESVPRHEFVEAWSPGAAWENVPLPIGHGQTISQPLSLIHI